MAGWEGEGHVVGTACGPPNINSSPVVRSDCRLPDIDLSRGSRSHDGPQVIQPSRVSKADGTVAVLDASHARAIADLWPSS